MTRQRSIELECPKCGVRQTTTVCDNINVSLEPTLKEKLFQGEINHFKCEECKENVFISIPLLYHDMERHILIQFYIFDFLRDKKFLEQFSKDGELSFTITRLYPRKLRKYYKGIHIVFDMGELVRYVIFRECLYNLWNAAS